jgi:hypothetical protein
MTSSTRVGTSACSAPNSVLTRRCRQSGSTRGYVMDLRTLWRFAFHWYDGRLDRGYVRRAPEAATEYLRSVGLSGPFWGP